MSVYGRASKYSWLKQIKGTIIILLSVMLMLITFVLVAMHCLYIATSVGFDISDKDMFRVIVVGINLLLGMFVISLSYKMVLKKIDKVLSDEQDEYVGTESSMLLEPISKIVHVQVKSKPIIIVDPTKYKKYSFNIKEGNDNDEKKRA